MSSKKIVYPAVPSRFNDEKWNQILDFIRGQGHIPFDHRCGVPFEDFEEGLGRERTLKFLIGTMHCCDMLWIFGCSEGVMGEWKAILDISNTKAPCSIRVSAEFDPEWQEYYKMLSPKYGDLLTQVRARQKLFAFVGPRAIGKSFWIDRLINHYGGRLGQVKTNSSRGLRNEADYRSYNLMSREEFEHGIEKGKFLEHDIYHGHYYGCSMSEIFKVLDRGQNGILAITPSGSSKLFAERDKMNLSIICLKPESEDVLMRNFKRRGIADPVEQERYLKEATDFTPPSNVYYKTVWISGCADIDEGRLISALQL